MDLATPGLHALGKPDLWSASLLGKISHDLVTGDNSYVRPMVGVGVTRVLRNAYGESGAGGANLQVEKEWDTFVSLHPAIEFGGEHALEDSTLLRPYLRLGLTRFLSDNDRHITASLQGAPAGVEPLHGSHQVGQYLRRRLLGLDVLTKKGATVRLDYTGQFSSHSSANAVWVKLSMPF
ncbi:autotransporter outer membrane beta-barrel domain-containing protein [Propionivibrio sp.]|uniref:autotransporter outer membrane beta-barrel domain-containing protein n=1 Tax=Propionivibrio sp. TaxID=2212460 RepID=UPI0025E8DD03|nr:autotransporter outer membrane beta-barrel domain-containing protein [Propionivibrio sp.]